MNAIELLDVHQALHGYEDGHRLISSSIVLNQKDRKTMLIMSDASGPGASIPDEGYLTGYPLLDSGYYALARTWAATEMKRPGCVWTHTLLINFTDLAQISSMNFLCSIFRKPDDSRNYAFYEKGFSLQTAESSNAAEPSSVSEKLLWALYQHPEIGVFTEADSQSIAITFRLWAQQWPRLRRTFRFCTLAYADRSSSDATFDLQFIPRAERAVRSRFKNSLRADVLSIEKTHWLSEALFDLDHQDSSKLRFFLREAGGDTVGGRELFAPFCDIYHAINVNDTVENIVQCVKFIRTNFSDDTAIYLKKALLTAILRNVQLAKEPTVLDFVLVNLIQLLTKPHPAKEVEEFLWWLWTNKPDRLFELFRFPGALSETLSSFLNLVPLVELLSKIKSLDDEALIAVLSLRPEILTSANFWSLGKHVELASNILRENQSLRERALQNFFAMPESVPSLVLQVFTSSEIFEILNTSSLETSSLLIDFWLDSALQDALALENFLLSSNANASLLFHIAKHLTPTHKFASSLDPWLCAISNKVGQLTTAEEQYFSAFLMARAFSNSTYDNAELLSLSLDCLYFAALYSTLTEDAWRVIEPHLPDLGIFSWWDRCQRIRVGVADTFVQKDLPPNLFVEVTKDSFLLEELFEAIERKGSAGRKYAKTVKKLLKNRGDLNSA